MDRIFSLYTQVLLAHIQTKTVDSQFHEKSAEFYKLLFEVFHTISEKRQDTKEDPAGDCHSLKKSTYNAIEEAKDIVMGMIKDKNTI